jgi:hypothetical protein
MCQLQRQETQLLERGEAVPDELVAETDRLWEPVIRFFLKRTRMLLAVDVKPYIVFDGAVLPAKIEEREQRARSDHDASRLCRWVVRACV